MPRNRATIAHIAHIARIEASRDIVAQASAEGLVARGERQTWQDNALERAGELAQAGKWRESRRIAEHARQA